MLSVLSSATLSRAQDNILFSDDFSRTGGVAQLAPWVAPVGGWGVTNQLIGSNPTPIYVHACLATNWVDYTVQARIRFSSENVWGGGIGGRLNMANGAHYQAWVYPEGSPGGSSVLKIVKFSAWTNWSYTPMVQVPLPGVHTNAHDLKMTFETNQITVYYDGTKVANVVDNGFDGTPAFTSGGIIAQMWADNNVMTVDDVVVTLNQPTGISSLSVLANHCAYLGCSGKPGVTYQIEASQDLINWALLTNMTASSNGIFNFTDLDAPNYPSRFYRTKQVSP